MMRQPFVLLSLSLLSFGAGVPSLAVRSSREAPPNGFKAMGPAPSDQVLKFHVALTSNNAPGLEEALMDVSTPGSPNFRKFLTKEQVDDFLKPTDETLEKVNAFFTANGIDATPLTPAGDWLTVSIPVAKANELFAADFQTFVHSASGQQAVRTLSYSVPASLSQNIVGINPGTSFDFGTFKPPTFQSVEVKRSEHVTRTASALPASCSTEMTPTCLQQLYGIPTALARQTKNTIGVSGFLNQFAQTADLTSFLKQFRTDLSSSTTFSTVLVDGGSNPQGKGRAGIEANLDTQYTIGIASGVPTTFFSVGTQNTDGVDGFIDIVTAMEKQATIPNVWTTSYAFNENDLDGALLTKTCNSYMGFGARGTSIFFSSGDGGVSGNQAGTCTTFVPTFPSTCPFVTSVGATTGFSPETSASFSSGGFSNFFPIPSYQATSVANYLTFLGSTNFGLFNRTGRGFPDVAAQGTNIPIFSGGQSGTVAGTSCSTPITASIVALLNDELITNGKSPLGFINPTIYAAKGEGFTDITTGDNPGCNTNGFPATTGWDPVTGLGTPIFSQLQTLFGA